MLGKIRTAACACGAIAVTARGEPARGSLCHCGACKRRSGSAFSLNATFDEGKVEISGTPQMFERHGEDGGHWAREYFCGRCGMRMFYRLELRPGMVAIPVGLFADPDFPPPNFEYYDELAMKAIKVTVEPPPERM